MEKAKISNILTRILKSDILLYCIVLVLVLRVFVVLFSVNLPLNIFFADITKSSLESLVNQTRQAIGLQPLVGNSKLDEAAQMKAQNMVQENYFNHTSPSGTSPWHWFLQAGYNYKYAGENLAVGFYESEEVYNAWLNSPSHKENIVNPNYTEVGTAVLRGFGFGDAVVVVQEFGSRQLVVQKLVNQPTQQPKQAPTLDNGAEEPSGQNEEVLSGQTVMTLSSGNASDNLMSRSLNYLIYNYSDMLGEVVYGVSLVIMGVLLALVFFNFNIKFQKQLVFRALILIVLLSAATLLDKEIVVVLIPHQLVI